MTRVEIYARKSCCLCDEAKATLARVRAEFEFELVEIDVDTQPELAAQYGHEVPVVFVAGRKAFKYRVDEAELRRKLDRARAA